jgi:hypothetical protein
VAERIVVSFWMPYAGLLPVTGRGYAERVRTVAQRAQSLHAELLSFGAESCSFGIEPEALEAAIELATCGASETAPGEAVWAVGIAQGELSPIGNEGLFAWGAPLVTAEALARIAEAGDVLVDPGFPAAASGLLLTIGRRRARLRGIPVRGLRVDARMPWRATAVDQIARVASPPLIGRDDPNSLLWMPGSRAVLRADPGLGGTRLLQELKTRVAPGPCLELAPSGSRLEPLGALRRGLAKAAGQGGSPVPSELQASLQRLLAGDGVPIEIAAAIVAAHLTGRGEDAPHGALLVDDANAVDESSIDACVRALAIAPRPFSCVVRLDATAAPPPPLADLTPGPEIDLTPFDVVSAESFAAGAVGGLLEQEARSRWARRGSYTPLGILEAITFSLATGELGFGGKAFSMRRPSKGRGKPRSAREWIGLRARTMTSPIQQVIVALVAFVGGEASLTFVQRVLTVANVTVDVAAEAAKLVRRRWLVEPQQGWLALPTRSHREALNGELRDEALRGVIHRAIGQVLAQEERGLGLAEAAHHLARGGDRVGAAQMAMAAARAALAVKLTQGAAHLLAFAREQDPSVDASARAELAQALPPAGNPDASSTTPIATLDAVDLLLDEDETAPFPLSTAPPSRDSEPPTVAGESPFGPEEEISSVTIAAAAPIHESESSRAPPSTTSDPPVRPELTIPDEGAANVGHRLTELAKEALLGADMRALERWTEGLRATGKPGRFAERMQAMVRLARGDVGEALRVLRSVRAELHDGASAAQRCQASLALGFALAVANRPDEALLEALDALSRARESDDEKGAHACLAFLAKLYASVDRGEDAARLRRFAKIAEDQQVPLAEVPI